MRTVAGGIAALTLVAIIIGAFWFGLEEILMYKEDPGVIPFTWIAGIVVHVAFLGILFFYLKGWGVIGINWRKNLIRKIKKKFKK